jgi:hypothetical protein
MNEIACTKCGETVSGPDAASVKVAMERHMAKRHPGKKAKK